MLQFPAYAPPSKYYSAAYPIRQEKKKLQNLKIIQLNNISGSKKIEIVTNKNIENY
jgi:hypothetical protein